MASFNNFAQLPYIPYNIIDYLVEHNENVWKLLKYPTYDCLSEPDLTHKEKVEMIWKNQEEQDKFNIFFTDLIQDAIADHKTILKIFDFGINPYNLYLATTGYAIDVLYGGKMSVVEYNGIPCNRGDVITTELMSTLNGSFIDGGVGEMQFNPDWNNRIGSDLGNDKTFTGKRIILGIQVGSVDSGSGCDKV